MLLVNLSPYTERKNICNSHYFVIAVLFRLCPRDREAVLSALTYTEYT